MLTVLGVALVGIAAALVIHIVGFYARSAAVGGALVARERAAIASAAPPTSRATRPPTSPATDRRTSPVTRAGTDQSIPSCRSTTPPAGRLAALLEIPAIGLVAPVLQGDGEGVLAVAVGHDPASSWQSGPGTVVLDGHDVTWFHRLTSLRAGEVISVVDPCETVDYRVVGGRVDPAGTAVANRPGRLVLVTCYPLDALYFTNQRYVLTATQVGPPRETAAGAQAAGTLRQRPAPPAGVPSAWAGVSTLAANPTPLGTLQVDGHPSISWSQSPDPLDAAADAQDAFFASLREAESSTATWSAIHTGLPLDYAVTALAGQDVVGNAAPMQTTLGVEGSVVRYATLTDGVVLGDGVQLDLTARLSVGAGGFDLVSWQAG
ncbi:MAG: class D sortase [Actinomycetota bacterium]|nr:class D sortase [Actinomycetota bacterium]